MTRNTNSRTVAKRNTTSRVPATTPTIVLKTVHDDIMRANPNATLTTKQMRAKLRVTMNDVHVRNSSWIFTQPEYDRVRAMFDPAYATKLARAAKRNNPSRARKSPAKSNAVVNETPTTTE